MSKMQDSLVKNIGKVRMHLESLGLEFDYAIPTSFDNRDTPLVVIADWGSIEAHFGSAKLFDLYYYNLEADYPDEGYYCSVCCDWISTTSYYNSPNCHVGEYEVICRECMDIDEYMWDFANDPNNCVENWDEVQTWLKDNNWGYKGAYDKHWSYGTSPKELYDELSFDRDVIFVLTNMQQFGVSYECWWREKGHDIDDLPKEWYDRVIQYDMDEGETEEEVYERLQGVALFNWDDNKLSFNYMNDWVYLTKEGAF